MSALAYIRCRVVVWDGFANSPECIMIAGNEYSFNGGFLHVGTGWNDLALLDILIDGKYAAGIIIRLK